MDLRLLSVKQVLGLMGISRSTLYAMMRAKEFPKPVQIAKRRIGWLNSDVEEWLKERATERGR